LVKSLLTFDFPFPICVGILLSKQVLKLLENVRPGDLISVDWCIALVVKSSENMTKDIHGTIRMSANLKLVY
jgi:hypothetical protein